MPVFTPEQLRTTASSILEAAGTGPNDAATVARELVEANLVGHDSHGVIRLMQYIDYVRQGYIKPAAQNELVVDQPSFAVIDGHFQLGQVTADRALQVGGEKAREHGMATAFARNCNHVGRLGSYGYRAALEGLATVMVVNAPGPGGVAAFGGTEQKLGTNPIAWSAPRGERPIVLDMTSSAVAEGKLRVAHQKGESVPEGWIIDGHGNPTTNPADFYADPPGAILPLGGLLGFKGYGLSVMIDIFGGILSGSGICRTDLPRGANGVWMYFIDVSKLVSAHDYNEMIERYVAHLKSSKTVPGVAEVLLPGEVEQQRRLVRIQEGVEVADGTWKLISELADSLGVTLEEGRAT